MNTRGLFLTISMIGAILSVGGCKGTREPPKVAYEPFVIAPRTRTLDAGVYYFPVTGADYRASLSEFLKQNPRLRCRYFGADDRLEFEGYSRQYTHIVGHTIVCNDTTTNAQDETIP